MPAAGRNSITKQIRFSITFQTEGGHTEEHITGRPGFMFASFLIHHTCHIWEDCQTSATPKRGARDAVRDPGGETSGVNNVYVFHPFRVTSPHQQLY